MASLLIVPQHEGTSPLLPVYEGSIESPSHLGYCFPSWTTYHAKRTALSLRTYHSYLHHKLHRPLQLLCAAANYRHTKPGHGPESPAQVDMGPCVQYVFSISRASQVSCNWSTIGALNISWCIDLVWIADLANLYVASSK